MGIRALKCPSCGARLEPIVGAPTVKCSYCGTISQIDGRGPEYPTAVTYTPAKWIGLIYVAPVAGIVLVSGIVGVVTSRSSPATEVSSAPVEAPRARAAPGAEQPEDPVVVRERALEAKLDAYSFRCLNGQTYQVLGGRNAYLAWAGDGYAPRARRVGGVRSVGGNSVTWCTDGVREALAVEPAIPSVDEPARAYAAALEAVSAVSVEAATYYERRNHEDDGMARGRELHRPLIDRWAAFAAADETLAAAHDREWLALAQTRRTRPAVAHTYELLLTAREIAVAADVPWGRLSTVELDPLVQRVARLEALVDELEASDDARQLVSSARGFLVQAKSFMRRRRDGPRWSTGERMILRSGPSAHWMVGGSPGAVLRTYGELASAAPPPRPRQIVPVELRDGAW